MSVTLLNADARNIPLADESVQCVITSPPYFGLRDYGVNGQIGLERTPQEYVDGLVSVFREVWRVLRPDGVLWLNLGDSYASAWASGRRSVMGQGSRTNRIIRMGDGLKEKDLIGIPWRVAFALQADGWYLRSDIIWHKPNPMPESVTDRPTKAHEYIFLLSKSANYFYDAEAIAEKSLSSDPLHKHYRENGKSDSRIKHNGKEGVKPAFGNKGLVVFETRNKRTVWEVATAPYAGAHFATFPPKLVEPMILAGSAPGDLVLDPFAGSGTVGRVCVKHQRRFVGLELNPAYIELAQDRTSNVQVQMI